MTQGHNKHVFKASRFSQGPSAKKVTLRDTLGRAHVGTPRGGNKGGESTSNPLRIPTLCSRHQPQAANCGAQLPWTFHDAGSGRWVRRKESNGARSRSQPDAFPPQAFRSFSDSGPPDPFPTLGRFAVSRAKAALGPYRVAARDSCRAVGKLRSRHLRPSVSFSSCLILVKPD